MIVGVVGLGNWGSKVIEEYINLRADGKIDEIVAIDADPNKLSNVSGPDKKFEEVETALPSLDGLHICTPNHTHFDIAAEGLKAGKNVLVEKPLTENSREAYDLVELASETGKILQTGHVFRFSNVIRTLRQKYQTGYFGDCYYMDLRWTHRIPTIQNTDVLWDLLAHPIDIINFITGEWPLNASGYARCHRRPGIVDSADIELELETFSAHIQVSWVNPYRRREIEIVGKEKSILADAVDQIINVYANTDDVKINPNNTIRTEIENFVHGSITGQNNFNSAIVGARTVDAIEMVEESVLYD
jgi:predicted dehydrogenase